MESAIELPKIVEPHRRRELLGDGRKLVALSSRCSTGRQLGHLNFDDAPSFEEVAHHQLAGVDDRRDLGQVLDDVRAIAPPFDVAE